MSIDPAEAPPRPYLGLANIRLFFLDLFRRERSFLAFLAVGFVVVGLSFSNPALARWVGFAFAAYAAVANDSIQTIGTFIASNRQQRWWVLWLFIGGLFLVTVTFSFALNDGDVSFGRLQSKGFSETPQSFSFLQIAAPLYLLLLTRLRMPVSTTFLLLTSFATETKGVEDVLAKSLGGYVIAFVAAMLVWLSFSRAFDRWFQGEAHPAWRAAQWTTSGALWCVWVAQDAANIAVYLPRRLDLVEFLGFALCIFLGLGLLFRSGGERIQQIVDEKSAVVDVRSATVIDLVYALILGYHLVDSSTPMSTTWVFLGLLGGRELAMSMARSTDRSPRTALWMMGRDGAAAGAGLAVSLLIAYFVNDGFRQQANRLLGL